MPVSFTADSSASTSSLQAHTPHDGWQHHTTKGVTPASLQPCLLLVNQRNNQPNSEYAILFDMLWPSGMC